MLSRRAAVEVADYRHRLLLRARSERPRRHRAGEKNYQVASPHAGSLALTANRDYGSKGPPRIGWAKGSFHPQRPFRVAGSNAGPCPHFRHWRVARRWGATTPVKRSVGLLR